MGVPQMIRRVVPFSRLLWQSNYMIRSMVSRDLRARYMGSVMGFFWSVIYPLTQIGLYFFVFAVLLKVRIGPEYGGTSFALWMIAGLLPWMFFAEVVNKAPSSVVEQSSLIKKIVFPSEIFPIINLSAAVLNHLIALTIFLVVIVLSSHGVSLKLLWIVPYLLATGVFALGLSWALAALNVFLRDVGHMTGVIVNIGSFLTPIFYPRSLIPEPLQWLFALNPMLHVVEGYRMALLGKTDADVSGYSYLVIVTMGAAMIGAAVFRKLKPSFADAL